MRVPPCALSRAGIAVDSTFVDKACMLGIKLFENTHESRHGLAITNQVQSLHVFLQVQTWHGLRVPGQFGSEVELNVEMTALDYDTWPEVAKCLKDTFLAVTDHGFGPWECIQQDCPEFGAKVKKHLSSRLLYCIADGSYY